jgi:RNA polymerase sigma factor (sigma-70 family)
VGLSFSTLSRTLRKIRKFQSQEIQRQRDQIRIPKSAHEQLSKLKKASAALGEGATVAQLAKETQIREKRIEQLQAISQPTSLNVATGSSGDQELLDQQADGSPAAFDLAIRSELVDLVKKLHPRQREVINLYHWQEMNFQQISDLLSLPIHRIKQIYKQALELLRQFLEGKINEFPPQPLLQWQQFIFAKLFLSTGLSSIFTGVVEKLQRLKRLHRNNSTPISPEQPGSQSETEVSSSHDLGLDTQNHDGIPRKHSAWHERLWRYLSHGVELFSRIFTYRIDSGGLRDGSKYLLGNCRHDPSGLAQFLGYWTRSPCGGGQPRCCFRDRWRGRGQIERCFQKEQLISKICRHNFVVFGHRRSRPRTKPKIEYSNNIVLFSRPSISQDNAFTEVNRASCSYF